MKYHIVGIGGAGMSAIAHILLDCGHQVTGSDAQRSAAWRALEERGVQIVQGHVATSVADDVDALVVTSAVRAPHPELDYAQAKGIPVLRRHDLWREWSQQRRVIAVAGTHGKTTTTALLAYALIQSGMQPGYVIGAEVPVLPRSACWGDPQAPLIIEADEYDRTFLALTPDIAIITTIEWDHVDIYPTQAEYVAAYVQFVDQVPRAEQVLVCGDDAGVRASIQRTNVRWYGIDEALALNPVACTRIPLDWSASAVQQDGAVQQWQAWYYDRRSLAMQLHRPLHIALQGRHNVNNALAVYAVAMMLGADPSRVATAFATFAGAKRRFEVVASVSDVTIVDDYAHHPTEVRAVLAAARQRFPGQRIVAYLQPHTYSRTATLIGEWRQAFGDADVVWIGDIYAAREQAVAGVDATWLAGQIDHAHVQVAGAVSTAAEHIAATMQAGDVLITMSAGDGTQVATLVAQALTTRMPST